jgi:hypothetical protein
MNVGVANNAGWAVDVSDVAIPLKGSPGRFVTYAELGCRVGVPDLDGYMFRVSYHVTTIGRLV